MSRIIVRQGGKRVTTAAAQDLCRLVVLRFLQLFCKRVIIWDMRERILERQEEAVKITWLGHSCFKVETEGYAIVLDPYEDGSVPGCAPVRETADEVLCSHEHFDHNFRKGVALRGCGASPVKVEVISTYHDDKKGRVRGSNQIHILDDGRVRIAHMGDLGCELEPEQVEKLKGLDAALVCVGGYYTIDAVRAKKLVEQIRPRVTIPMHYRGDGFGFDVLGTVEDYAKLCDDVKRCEGNALEVDPDTPEQTAVLTMRRQ